MRSTFQQHLGAPSRIRFASVAKIPALFRPVESASPLHKPRQSLGGFTLIELFGVVATESIFAGPRPDEEKAWSHVNSTLWHGTRAGVDGHDGPGGNEEPGTDVPRNAPY